MSGINYYYYQKVCNAQCAMFCNKIECCNVATCQFNEKQCKVGYYGTAHTHIPTYDPNSAGKLFLVKDIGLWQTSKYLNNNWKQIFC